jgi:hypothetical protein
MVVLVALSEELLFVIVPLRLDLVVKLVARLEPDVAVRAGQGPLVGEAETAVHSNPAHDLREGGGLGERTSDEGKRGTEEGGEEGTLEYRKFCFSPRTSAQVRSSAACRRYSDRGGQILTPNRKVGALVHLDDVIDELTHEEPIVVSH